MEHSETLEGMKTAYRELSIEARQRRFPNRMVLLGKGTAQ